MRNRKGKSARIAEKIKKKIGVDVSVKSDVTPVKEEVKVEETKKETPIAEAKAEKPISEKK